MHYTPYVDPYNGHEYVDLGLPSGTKWAKMNVGAISETDYGNYYQYGKGANDYFVTSGQSIYSGTENPLAASADTAAQVMGGFWHIPTITQFNELTANTTSEWATIGGVNGYKFTATNGNYVFFPYSGQYLANKLIGVGSYAYYMSSTPVGGNYSSILEFREKSFILNDASRNKGISVRGVVG